MSAYPSQEQAAAAAECVSPTTVDTQAIIAAHAISQMKTVLGARKTLRKMAVAIGRISFHPDA